MTKLRRGTFGVAVLALALAGFTGPASAGNGHGNGQGNGNGNGNSNAGVPPAAESSSSTAPSPGNSGNAPGHNKDAQPSSQPEPSAQTGGSSGASTSSPGNSDKHKGGGNQNSPSQPGVKPANNTAKNTSCTTGGSSSGVTCASTGPISAPASGKADASKKYGNGKTAAQIATQNGAAPGTKLYGPGNSQPHKVVTCGHRHGVDVHALKNHPGGKTCGSQEPPVRPADPSPKPPSTDCTCKDDSPHDPGITPPLTIHSTPPPTPHKGSSGTAGGVVAIGGDLHGVLASVAVVGQGTLPFTGFPLWAIVGVALGLIALGLTLRGPVPGRLKDSLERRFLSRRRAEIAADLLEP
jgi:hypothetical protein